MSTNLKNNVSFQLYSEVNEIAKVLSASCKLKYFGFLRVYPDGKFICLASDHRWPENHFIHQQLQPASADNFHSIQSGVFLPALNQDGQFGFPDGVFHSVKEKFDYENPLIFLNKYGDFNEVACFVIDHDDQHSFFLNHLDVFEKFIHYFKDQASDLIALADKDPAQVITNKEVVKHESQESRSLEDIIPKHGNWIYHNHTWSRLTCKEYQMLNFVAHGQTTASIASKSFISIRTVESHLANIKNKLKVSSKIELVDIFWNNSFTTHVNNPLKNK